MLAEVKAFEAGQLDREAIAPRRQELALEAAGRVERKARDHWDGAVRQGHLDVSDTGWLPARVEDRAGDTRARTRAEWHAHDLLAAVARDVLQHHQRKRDLAL